MSNFASKRSNYINQVWPKYPHPKAEPKNVFKVVSLSQDELVLKPHFFPFAKLTPRLTYKASCIKILAGENFLFNELLVPGDLVLVTSGDLDFIYLSLLAPFLHSPNSVVQKSLRQMLAAREFLEFLKGVREFFTDFSEVHTPFLLKGLSSEPYLSPLSVQVGRAKEKYFLPTSPELALKKALVWGYDSKIFEIKTCFRDEEYGSWHQTEFKMLEWYECFTDLQQLQTRVLNLVSFLAPDFIKNKRVYECTYQELFKKYTGFLLTPHSTLDEMLTQMPEFCEFSSQFDDLESFLDFVFAHRIEPELKEFDLLFIRDFPQHQAALARISNSGWAERFEFYINGVEIANAYHELTDPVEQKRRMDQDLFKREQLNKADLTIDADFIYQLGHGMPPCVGIALGLERLFICLNPNKLQERAEDNFLAGIRLY